jgi:hypothetical protein
VNWVCFYCDFTFARPVAVCVSDLGPCFLPLSLPLQTLPDRVSPTTRARVSLLCGARCSLAPNAVARKPRYAHCRCGQTTVHHKPLCLCSIHPIDFFAGRVSEFFTVFSSKKDLREYRLMDTLVFQHTSFTTASRHTRRSFLSDCDRPLALRPASSLLGALALALARTPTLPRSDGGRTQIFPRARRAALCGRVACACDGKAAVSEPRRCDCRPGIVSGQLSKIKDSTMPSLC